MHPLRIMLYRQLFPEGWSRPALSPTNRCVCTLIIAASVVTVLETEITLQSRYSQTFIWLEYLFVTLFSIEYLARIYAAGEDARYAGFTGRIKYIFSLWAIIDLIAILPFYLGFLTTSNVFMLRLLRIARLLRLARLGRFSHAWNALAEALSARVYELLLSIGLAALLLLFSSACLYAVEASNQPEAFGSIPRALWWSISTMTTVGYGDVTPITSWGKFFAGITAVAGIGIIAMPTGILAAAFSAAFQKNHK